MLGQPIWVYNVQPDQHPIPKETFGNLHTINVLLIRQELLLARAFPYCEHDVGGYYIINKFHYRHLAFIRVGYLLLFFLQDPNEKLTAPPMIQIAPQVFL